MRWIVALVAATAAFGAAPTLDDLDSLDGLGGVALSGDGVQVAYVFSHGRPGARRTEIRVIPSAGGESRTVAQGNSPAWSPDGGTLAFFGAGRQVFLVAAAGGEPRALTSHEGYIDRFQWSPDGRWIALLARPKEAADLRFLVMHSSPTASPGRPTRRPSPSPSGLTPRRAATSTARSPPSTSPPARSKS